MFLFSLPGSKALPVLGCRHADALAMRQLGGEIVRSLRGNGAKKLMRFFSLLKLQGYESNCARDKRISCPARPSFFCSSITGDHGNI
ncbi:hypothetical protein ACOSOMT5_P1039 [Acidiphilium sp. MT5]